MIRNKDINKTLAQVINHLVLAIPARRIKRMHHLLQAWRLMDSVYFTLIDEMRSAAAREEINALEFIPTEESN